VLYSGLTAQNAQKVHYDHLFSRTCTFALEFHSHQNCTTETASEKEDDCTCALKKTMRLIALHDHRFMKLTKIPLESTTFNLEFDASDGLRVCTEADILEESVSQFDIWVWRPGLGGRRSS
jgi:hypothetical protein